MARTICMLPTWGVSIRQMQLFATMLSFPGRWIFPQPGLTDKQQAVPLDVQAWTKRVIRHRCGKRIYRVLTPSGIVDVTEDHSLLSPSGELLKPVDIATGTPLMHGYPGSLIAGVDTISEEQAIRSFVEHYRERCYDGQRKKVPDCVFSSRRIAADGDRKDVIDTNNQLSAAWYYMMLRAMNFNVSMNTHADKPDMFRLTWSKNTPSKNVLAVKKVSVLHESYDDYVFDMETATGNFQAGVGSLIVKNTDSVFLLSKGASMGLADKIGRWSAPTLVAS